MDNELIRKRFLKFKKYEKIEVNMIDYLIIALFLILFATSSHLDREAKSLSLSHGNLVLKEKETHDGVTLLQSKNNIFFIDTGGKIEEIKLHDELHIKKQGTFIPVSFNSSTKELTFETTYIDKPSAGEWVGDTFLAFVSSLILCGLITLLLQVLSNAIKFIVNKLYPYGYEDSQLEEEYKMSLRGVKQGGK